MSVAAAMLTGPVRGGSGSKCGASHASCVFAKAKNGACEWLAAGLAAPAPEGGTASASASPSPTATVAPAGGELGALFQRSLTTSPAVKRALFAVRRGGGGAGAASPPASATEAPSSGRSLLPSAARSLLRLRGDERVSDSSSRRAVTPAAGASASKGSAATAAKATAPRLRLTPPTVGGSADDSRGVRLGAAVRTRESSEAAGGHDAADDEADEAPDDVEAAAGATKGEE